VHQLALHQVSVAIEGRWLVQDVSLTLPPNQLTALLGPNGAGKTTLLRLLAGVWQPTTGQVTLNQRPLQQFSRLALAKQLTLVPSPSQINFAFTVQEVVMMGRHPHRNRWQPATSADHQWVALAMQRTDVSHLAHRFVTELSGGERQRVLIARSLATQAQIILLDEPTANLDIGHTLALFELLKKLACEGKTIAFATHDMSTVSRYAQQVILMHQGHLVDWGASEQVLTEERLRNVFGVEIEKVAGEVVGIFKLAGNTRRLKDV